MWNDFRRKEPWYHPPQSAKSMLFPSLSVSTVFPANMQITKLGSLNYGVTAKEVAHCQWPSWYSKCVYYVFVNTI